MLSLLCFDKVCKYYWTVPSSFSSWNRKESGPSIPTRKMMVYWFKFSLNVAPSGPLSRKKWAKKVDKVETFSWQLGNKSRLVNGMNHSKKLYKTLSIKFRFTHFDEEIDQSRAFFEGATRADFCWYEFRQTFEPVDVYFDWWCGVFA